MSVLPAWAAEAATLIPADASLPADFPGINLVLNRPRLARFLADFAQDSVLRDLLLLDLAGRAAGAEISSTGTVEEARGFGLRPFRLWEYLWLMKGLGLSQGGLDVLDLGGPASHVVMLSALAGNSVVSVDINPVIVDAGRRCGRSLGLKTLDVRLGDMCRLEGIADQCFDRIICASVLEHLMGAAQEQALSEMARVLRPGGIVGLTFDYGPPAPGANEHLPPPHEPPETVAHVRSRYERGGLEILGNTQFEEPVPGSLFHDKIVQYVIASLFLGKSPVPQVAVPRAETDLPSLLVAIRLPDLAQSFFGGNPTS